MSEAQESVKDDILQPGTSGERSKYLLRATLFIFYYYYYLVTHCC